MCCHPHCHSEGSLQGDAREGVTLAPEELSALYAGGHLWGNQITLRTPEALELRAVCGERHRILARGRCWEPVIPSALLGQK